jgi:seryl-tRNA synthetase
MLDLKLIREQTEEVERGIARRGEAISVRPILDADAARRQVVTEAEELKAERNRASEAIGQAKRRGESADAAMAACRHR